MDEIQVYPGTISSKGQITLPKEVRIKLQVDTGDVIRFIIDSKNNLVSVEKLIANCPICKGRKQIDERPCFTCDATGAINPSISVIARTYSLYNYQIIPSIIWEDALGSQRKFPLIKLASKVYKKATLDVYQDFLQLEAIAEFADDYSVQGVGGYEEIHRILYTKAAIKMIEAHIIPLKAILNGMKIEWLTVAE